MQLFWPRGSSIFIEPQFLPIRQIEAMEVLMSSDYTLRNPQWLVICLLDSPMPSDILPCEFFS